LAAFTHRLWTKALFGVAAVFARRALGPGAFQLGHVDFVLARDKAVCVVEVFRGRQQVRVRPDRVPAFDAAASVRPRQIAAASRPARPQFRPTSVANVLALPARGPA
jgi:hypothetical protein